MGLSDLLIRRLLGCGRPLILPFGARMRLFDTPSLVQRLKSVFYEHVVLAMTQDSFTRQYVSRL